MADPTQWAAADVGESTSFCPDGIIEENASTRPPSSLSDIWPEQADPPLSASRFASGLSACDFILNINNYIAVGCLRLERFRYQVTAEAWSPCSRWQWLSHPRDLVAPTAELFVQNALQEVLFNGPVLQAYRNLHQAGWIRLEFKITDTDCCLVRVYILPEDIGRRMIERNDQSLKKLLQRLLAELDISREAWAGTWLPNSDVVHVDSALDEVQDNDVSLFYLFNTLPSPTPDESAVKNPHAKAAMKKILDGTVDGIKTTMLAYQRRSAAMMLQKETQPAQLVDPRLRKLVDQNGADWYCDVTNGTCLRTPRMYEAARGGICAETMGLGKTLICLALILATREQSSHIPAEYSVGTMPVRSKVGSLLDMCGSAIGRTGTPWKSHFEQWEQDGSEYSKCRGAIQRGAGYYFIPSPVPRRASRNIVVPPPRKIWLSTATLVVVPANLVRQWEREISKHTKGLKVLVMKANKTDLPPAAELAEYDIILFSRPRFDKESRDGSDDQGRRGLAASKHDSRCSGQLQSNGAGCICFEAERIYHSPLRDLHFKRLITDEGHTMGSSNTTTKTNAIIVVDSLQLTSRWIVSGTPTQGLYGVDSSPAFEDYDSADSVDMLSASTSSSPPSGDVMESQNSEQERRDLEKLGNIATTYLKSRPWANDRHSGDFAAWSQYVMQPRHGSKSHGNLDCLRSTLEGMIIRHRPLDVEKDVELPPLNQKVVYLEGSFQDKLSLNIFSLMITSNAVTSERKDADYLFHPRQRKALGQLVANLRQASFFWSGFTNVDVEFTVNVAKSFLAKNDIITPNEDRYLLQKVVEFGERALSNSIWLAASQNHEMPFYVRNDWFPGTRMAWALDGLAQDPTLIGSTQLISLQKFVQGRLSKGQSMDGIEEAGNAARVTTWVTAQASIPSTLFSRSKASKLQKKLENSLPTLAGGLKIGEDLSPKKKQRARAQPTNSIRRGTGLAEKDKTVDSVSLGGTPRKASSTNTSWNGEPSSIPPPKSVLESPKKTPESSFATSSRFSPESASIISTASSKLSYLVTQVLKYHKAEKIIIFYETENMAYYIAQAFEAIHVEHLIYAKTLSSDRRSSYIVTFNQSSRFRVLLMDISQAAFGLDISSASRVYFINPVFNKQIEAQAVKRAHRIGQFRPVYVETLVLRDSIEEVIIERRKAMSSDEQQKCKTVLDDQTMYDWIKNVRFVPLPTEDIPGPTQMSALQNPQPVFTAARGKNTDTDDPDAGLVIDSPSSTRKSKAKGKRKASMHADDSAAVNIEGDTTAVSTPSPTKRPRRTARVTFLIDSESESDEPHADSPAPDPIIPGPNHGTEFSKDLFYSSPYGTNDTASGDLFPTPPYPTSNFYDQRPPVWDIKERSVHMDALPRLPKLMAKSKAERSRLDAEGARGYLEMLERREEKLGSMALGAGSGNFPRVAIPSSAMRPAAGSDMFSNGNGSSNSASTLHPSSLVFGPGPRPGSTSTNGI